MVLSWQALAGENGHEAGRRLLTQLYFSQTGQPLPPICTTPRGKPYFPDCPLHFSISHTKGHVFCCLAECNIGIDAEEIGRTVPDALLTRFCSPAEQSRVLSASDPKDALLRLWVLKESHAKLTGLGLGNYLSQTDFSPFDPRIQEIDGCYVAILTEERNASHAL